MNQILQVNIFEESGTKIDPYLASACVAGIRTVASLFSSIFLKFVPRRVLMLVSGLLMALFMALMGSTTFLMEQQQEDISSQNTTEAIGLVDDKGTN